MIIEIMLSCMLRKGMGPTHQPEQPASQKGQLMLDVTSSFLGNGTLLLSYSDPTMSRGWRCRVLAKQRPNLNQ